MANRDKHRDNDDVRAPLRDRAGTEPDTKSEARGDARENVGNNARGTDANPTGPEGNDGQRGRERPDEFDRDLQGKELRGQQYIGEWHDEITES